ncbi:hypothetical protein [Mycoavidus sp. SF9855]|uniref:hypothetical protein n=1 Tax=Mycoavidus sp. SF9855 TaxID=2968475 RepID=UPI00211BE7C3|nr:hypothetical protein [Mycoavidus sp. SF9855]UUM21031.1 hypothetical protein NQD60_06055 [Mycoavidus sp. SF9855]
MHSAILISPLLTVDKDYAKASLKLIWAEHIDLIQKNWMDTNGTAIEKQEKCFLLAINRVTGGSHPTPVPTASNSARNLPINSAEKFPVK